ncbi:helix-turn-helix domain-containing protein [Paenilisteria newyorkensis]|uniref:helix-turn-helix domain-containing protein n=1 Tax=Listeria newyorkensis TaxID=1497681 RepID=UPI000669EE38|nr:helix-turn-helix transcriptional regulator [Listeria newyorkensis]KMT62702.1 helix-turn-helix domain-containing protein [Listeria newyorkensis]
MDIGERISILRDKKNISQKELADKINVNKSVMNRIESGERPVRDEELKNISIVLGVTSDYLLGNSTVPYPEPLKRFVEDRELNAWLYDMIENRPEDIKRVKEILELIDKKSNENIK